MADAGELPMFPLGTVLLPGALLPLHVFEPRYRELVRVCLEGDAAPEFGVALIERGSEVGGGDARFAVGCVARIVEARPLDDGRWILATVGTRRIRVEQWLPDAPYPRASVVDWPDPPAGPRVTDAREGLVATCRKVLALAAELGEPVARATLEFDDEPVLAMYQVAAVSPLGPLDRLTVLAAPTPEERVTVLTDLLDGAAAMLAARVAGG